MGIHTKHSSPVAVAVAIAVAAVAAAAVGSGWVRSGLAGHNIVRLGKPAKDLGRGQAAIVVAVLIIIQHQQQ